MVKNEVGWGIPRRGFIQAQGGGLGRNKKLSNPSLGMIYTPNAMPVAFTG